MSSVGQARRGRVLLFNTIGAVGAGSTQGPTGAAPLPSAEDLGARSPIEPGTVVEVRNRVEGTGVRGVSVAEDGDYLIRRLSDGSILPGSFERDAIRRERRRHSGWWY
jgi:hypothetical protein